MNEQTNFSNKLKYHFKFNNILPVNEFFLFMTCNVFFLSHNILAFINNNPPSAVINDIIFTTLFTCRSKDDN